MPAERLGDLGPGGGGGRARAAAACCSSTGNADFNGRTDWGDSVLELSPAAQPAAQLDADATRPSSTTPTPTSAAHPGAGCRRWAGAISLVQGGKDAKLHLLDLDRLDGTTGGAGPRLGGELQEVSTPGGAELLTAPAVWRTAGAI